ISGPISSRVWQKRAILTENAANQRLKLTGAAILVSELQRPCRRPRQLSRAFGGVKKRFRAGLRGSLMRLYRFGLFVWVVGTVLIVLSWTGTVSPSAGWAGFAIAGVGVVVSWLPHVRAQTSPQQRPVKPSGVSGGRRLLLS